MWWRVSGWATSIPVIDTAADQVAPDDSPAYPVPKNGFNFKGVSGAGAKIVAATDKVRERGFLADASPDQVTHTFLLDAVD